MRSEAEFALALRQQQLLARSAALRDAAGGHAQALAPAFTALDTARAIGAWLYARRVWIGAALLVVLVVRPRRAWRVARWGWWAWRNSRRALAWLTVAGLVARRADAAGSSIHQHHGV